MVRALGSIYAGSPAARDDRPRSDCGGAAPRGDPGRPRPLVGRTRSHRDVRPWATGASAADDEVAPPLKGGRDDEYRLRCADRASPHGSPYGEGRTPGSKPTTSTPQRRDTRRSSPGPWAASAIRGSKASARPPIGPRRSSGRPCNVRNDAGLADDLGRTVPRDTIVEPAERTAARLLSTDSAAGGVTFSPVGSSGSTSASVPTSRRRRAGSWSERSEATVRCSGLGAWIFSFFAIVFAFGALAVAGNALTNSKDAQVGRRGRRRGHEGDADASSRSIPRW